VSLSDARPHVTVSDFFSEEERSVGCQVEPDAMKTLLSLGFLAVVAATPAAAARDRGTTVATLTGTCTRLTLMDVATDPTLCSDTLLNLKLPSGQLGFTFVVGQKAIMSFFGTRRKRIQRHNGDSGFPIYKVYVTSDDGTVDLIAVGSCVLSHPHDKKAPAKVSCAANTIRGNFAGEFVSNGVIPGNGPLQ
jgi:hypothetical protein